MRSKVEVLAMAMAALFMMTACGGGSAPVSRAGVPGTTTGTGAAGSGGATQPGGTGGATASSTNRAPSIAGAPAGSVAPGNTFIFQPTARDADNDLLSFSVVNLPVWARFDPFSGQIAGTPSASHVGTSAPITILVSDGRAVTALPSFTITVGSGGGIVGGGTRSATIAWQPPTQNTDGSAVAALASYKIHYGPASRTYTNVVTVNNPGLTRYVIENLSPGTYYVAMTALAGDGVESDYSSETVARLN